ncbi:MAG: superoxide dismutase, Ni [Candidatus Liptonbacteria bacterium]|nr:superoxide dismutase, Ni [Candidatus Liptonbacteria bacterium]
MKLIGFLSKILPTVTAEAHCDIPCGIYDPTPAKIAAKTVQKMVMQLGELKVPEEMDTHTLNAYHNAVMRRVAVKEAHAETCKRELSILWSDFFKPEHVKKFPALHETFWNALKLCSKNKQEVNDVLAKELVSAVDDIAKIFYDAKGDPKRYDAYKEITDKLF